MLTAGVDGFAVFNYDATASQDLTASKIQTVLEKFATIGQGNVKVTAVSDTPGSFDIQLQPIPAGDDATRLDFPNLTVVDEATAAITSSTTGVILNVTGTTGSYVLTDGSSAETEIINYTGTGPAPVISIKKAADNSPLSPSTLVNGSAAGSFVLTPGSLALTSTVTTTTNVPLTVSASDILNAQMD